MAIDFEGGPDVKGGTKYMATYAMGVLPLHEGLIGRVGSRRRCACVLADQDERRFELEPCLRMALEGGVA